MKKSMEKQTISRIVQARLCVIKIWYKSNSIVPPDEFILYSEYTTTKFPGSQYMSVYNHALLPAYPSILPNFARRRKHRL